MNAERLTKTHICSDSFDACVSMSRAQIQDTTLRHTGKSSCTRIVGQLSPTADAYLYAASTRYVSWRACTAIKLQMHRLSHCGFAACIETNGESEGSSQSNDVPENSSALGNEGQPSLPCNPVPCYPAEPHFSAAMHHSNRLGLCLGGFSKGLLHGSWTITQRACSSQCNTVAEALWHICRLTSPL